MTDDIASAARRIVELGERAAKGPLSLHADEAWRIKDAAGDSVAMMHWVHLRGRRPAEEVRATAQLFVAARNDATAVASAYLQLREQHDALVKALRELGFDAAVAALTNHGAGDGS